MSFLVFWAGAVLLIGLALIGLGLTAPVQTQAWMNSLPLHLHEGDGATLVLVAFGCLLVLLAVMFCLLWVARLHLREAEQDLQQMKTNTILEYQGELESKRKLLANLLTAENMIRTIHALANETQQVFDRNIELQSENKGGDPEASDLANSLKQELWTLIGLLKSMWRLVPPPQTVEEAASPEWLQRALASSGF